MVVRLRTTTMPSGIEVEVWDEFDRYFSSKSRIFFVGENSVGEPPIFLLKEMVDKHSDIYDYARSEQEAREKIIASAYEYALGKDLSDLAIEGIKTTGLNQDDAEILVYYQQNILAQTVRNIKASAQSQPSCTIPTDVSIAGTLAEDKGFKSPHRLVDRCIDPTYP